MKKICLAILFSTFIFGSQGRAAELCAALDRSGSLTQEEFTLQLEGLASAVEDPLVIPRNGTVAVSVVIFDWGAFAAVPATVIDSEWTAGDLASRIRAIPWNFGHRTDIVGAIEECMRQFADPAEEWIIDISTDGQHSQTLGTDPEAARNAALAGGLDTLNALGVGEADLPSLQSLAWPQPASEPPDRGFVMYIPDFSVYIEAMREKVNAELLFAVPLDIKPTSCPNPLNLKSGGRLPVAVLGTTEVDVTEIDPSTLLLEGVPPLRWHYEDVATPFDPELPIESCADCSRSGADGHLDLTLTFDKKAVIAALGEMSGDECLLLKLSGSLREEHGGRGITGGDVVRVQDGK